MRKLFCLALLLLVTASASAQTSMSFYHFGDMATFQNGSQNPTYTPDARVFFSIIPNIHAHFNNKLSYNQLIRKEGEENIVDINDAISELQQQNLLSTHAGVDLFHIGYSVPNGPVFSIFAKERVEGDFLYPKELMEFVFEGNGPHLGETIDVGSMGASYTHFREIGVGVSHQLNRQLRVGARLKMLQGFFNFSTPGSMEATLEVDPQTYAWTLNTKDVVFRTAGANSYEDGSYLISPGNGGMAVDVGFEFMVNRYLGFSGSVTDLGWINWNNDIEARQYQDETFEYDGVDMRNVNDLVDALQDSLFDRFTTVETNTAYRTWLPTTAYGSLIWRQTDNTTFLGSVGARYIQGQMKMLYGGGIRQKVGPMIVTLNAIKLPQHFFNVGAGFVVRGGPVQYYLAVDQVVNFSATDIKALDVRTGMNFLIGRRAAPGLQGRGGATTIANQKGPKGKTKGVSTGFFLGSKVKTKRREGIYSVIKKQKRRSVPASIKPPKIRHRKAKIRSSVPKSQKIPSPGRKRN